VNVFSDLMHRVNNPKFQLPISLGLLLILLAYHWNAPLADFANNYFGGVMILSDVEFDALYDPYLFNLNAQKFGLEDVFLNFTVLPPITAFVFAPLSILSPIVAKVFFNLLSASLFLWSLFRIIKYLGLDYWWVSLIPLLFFTPILSNFYQGQVYLLLLVLLLEGWLAEEKGNHWQSAVLWGLAAMLKIFPAILILFLLQEKKYRQIVRIASVCLALFSISLLLVPIQFWMEYVWNILPRVLSNEFNNPFTTSYQSMSVVFRKLFVFDAILNPHPLSDLPWVSSMLEFGFKAFVLWISWQVMRGMETSFQKFALLLFAAVVFSGYSSVYSLVMLIPMLIAFIQSKYRFSREGVILFFAINLPISFFLTLSGIVQLPRLLLFMVLFLSFVYKWKPKLDYRIMLSLSALVLIFGSVKWLSYEKIDSELIVLENPALLSVGFSLDGADIEVKTFDQSGIHSQLMPFSAEGIDSTSVTVINDQLVLKGRTITNEIGFKKNPVLVNENEVLFLSDAGRGVGFYALRKLRIIEGE
jgi:hypothetical protein